MEEIKRDVVGYTVLVKDKYILCGTSRQSYFKEIDDMGRSNPRQYLSVKIALNNACNHLASWWGEVKNEIDQLLIDNGYFYTESRTLHFPPPVIYPDYSPESMEFLKKKGIIKPVKISQVLSLMKEPIFKLRGSK